MAGFGPINAKWKETLIAGSIDSATTKAATRYLDSLARYYRHVQRRYSDRRDSVSQVLEAAIGTPGLQQLKEDYHNDQLELLVLDRTRKDQSIETKSRIIQKYEPGFMIPLSKTGRAHFYAPYKNIGNARIDTFWFNLMVIWIVTIALYGSLYYNLLQKLINVFENMKFKNSEK
jgi:hypothetical protein